MTKTLLACVVALCVASPAQQKTSNPLAGWQVVPDLSQRISKLQPVHMPFNTSGLSQREVAEVKELTHALQLLDGIYWRQIDPEALPLETALLKSDPDPCSRVLHQQSDSSASVRDQVACYLVINGSRYDLFHDNQPFVYRPSEGPKPQPPGRNFYRPYGEVSAKEIEQYVSAHPDQKNALYSSTSIVRKDGNRFEAVPYHNAFAQWLKPAAESLRKAASLSDDPAFANFLRARADALLSDDYYPSDLQWLDLKSPKIDIIYAPYETYNDGLLGVKGSYGAAIMIRDEAESKKLELFQRYVPDIQDALPIAAQDRPSKKGQPSPMEVVNSPYRAGDLLHGYQVVADNLPNDARIHQEKGTKKIFFKNFMDARTNEVVLPTAKQVMDPAQAALASGEGYLAAVMMHEICHGLGPAFARTKQGQRDIREAIGPGYSALEEAKADVVGMFGLDWLIDHGALPKEKRNEYYASYVAGIFRSVRFGAGEAHSRAEMMEFNYLAEHGAIVHTEQGRYQIAWDKMPTALSGLSKELLEIEATGDRARNDAWFKKYGSMPSDLRTTLDKIEGVPVDIVPVWDFPTSPQ